MDKTRHLQTEELNNKDNPGSATQRLQSSEPGATTLLSRLKQSVTQIFHHAPATTLLNPRADATRFLNPGEAANMVAGQADEEGHKNHRASLADAAGVSNRAAASADTQGVLNQKVKHPFNSVAAYRAAIADERGTLGLFLRKAGILAAAGAAAVFCLLASNPAEHPVPVEQHVMYKQADPALKPVIAAWYWTDQKITIDGRCDIVNHGVGKAYVDYSLVELKYEGQVIHVYTHADLQLKGPLQILMTKSLLAFQTESGQFDVDGSADIMVDPLFVDITPNRQLRSEYYHGPHYDSSQDVPIDHVKDYWAQFPMIRSVSLRHAVGTLVTGCHNLMACDESLVDAFDCGHVLLQDSHCTRISDCFELATMGKSDVSDARRLHLWDAWGESSGSASESGWIVTHDRACVSALDCKHVECYGESKVDSHSHNQSVMHLHDKAQALTMDKSTLLIDESTATHDW